MFIQITDELIIMTLYELLENQNKFFRLQSNVIEKQQNFKSLSI